MRKWFLGMKFYWSELSFNFIRVNRGEGFVSQLFSPSKTAPSAVPLAETRKNVTVHEEWNE